MNKLTIIASFVLAAALAVAAEDSDPKPSAALQFKQAQQLLTIADEARDNEEFVDSIKLYRESLLSYTTLSKHYPDWQPGITQFRISYCNNQLEALMKKVNNRDLAEIAKSGKPGMEPEEQPPAFTNAVPKEPVAATAGNATPLSREEFNKIRSEVKALMEKGDTEKARSLIFEGLKTEPDDRNMRMLMGMVHCKAGEYENAINLMESLVQEDVMNPIAHVILGTACFGLNKMQEAAKQMQEALKINPRLGEAHFNLAQVLLAGKPADTAEARLHYKTALELGCKPDNKMSALLLETAPEKK